MTLPPGEANNFYFSSKAMTMREPVSV